MWEVLCGRVSEILLCEGGDVELGARTSKHLLVFAFDALSLTLSLLYCVLHHIVHIISMLVLIVYAHTCVQPREFYMALNSYLEEFRGDSPEPLTGNSATLFGYSKCIAFSF